MFFNATMKSIQRHRLVDSCSKREVWNHGKENETADTGLLYSPCD